MSSNAARRVAVHSFHRANIHERRCAAKVARAIPLTTVIATVTFAIYGAYRNPPVLLYLCAIFNLMMWALFVLKAITGIVGVLHAQKEIDKGLQTAEQEMRPCSEARDEETSEGSEISDRSGRRADLRRPLDPDPEQPSGGDMTDSVVHLVVLPNYKEPEEILRQTLEALAQTEDPRSMMIVLAMESREQEAGEKADRLKRQFLHKFRWILVAMHPPDLVENHSDGSADSEVPGKASNLKWAVNKGYEECKRDESMSITSIVLTVADADCIFHPGYFTYISRHFNQLREAPGLQHNWAMWQAPQLPYRNYYTSPICSRSWGYIASLYEFGGTYTLEYGGHHMTFSGYSLPLQLAMSAQAWDGDVVAEDHHAYLKCFFYSIYASARESLDTAVVSGGCRPQLRVHTVPMPVKSTSVCSDEPGFRGYVQSFKERFHQAKRHAQGVAELSYALLACYDTLRHLPLRMYSWQLVAWMSRVLLNLIVMHLAPVLQALCLAILTLYWYANDKNVPMCPDRIWFFAASNLKDGGQTVLCGLAGAWVLVWPVVIPATLVILVNYLLIYGMFVTPGMQADKAKASIWFAEDGRIPGKIMCIPRSVHLFMLVAWDVAVLLPVMMLPYGIIVMLIAYVNCCFKGNRFKYITASKGMQPATKEAQMATFPLSSSSSFASADEAVDNDVDPELPEDPERRRTAPA